MDHRWAFEILQAIEHELDVNAYWLGGIQLWPLLRQQLWIHLLRGGGAKPSSPAAAPAVAAPNVGNHPVHIAPDTKSGLSTADVLFLSRREDHTEIFADGGIDRMIDPMIWFARRERLTTLKISSVNGVPWNGLKQMVPSLMVHPERTPLKAIDGSEADAAITLLTDIERIAGPHPITRSTIISLVRRLNQRADCYGEVLDIVRPRLVMLAVFYAGEAAAMNHACRKRGIPVVDIQHGKQGQFHAMYGGWSALPGKGYSILPDVFWTWGEASAAMIESTLPRDALRPRAVVGGNRWLATWRSDANLRCVPAVEALFKRMRASSRSILLSLQPLEEPIPDHVLTVMRRTPSDWLWLVRTHPHQRTQVPKIVELLERTGVKYFDVDTATSAPLYPLLTRADTHVTCWSSVAYEAVAFGKPSIVVHPTAAKLYAAQIKSGQFRYADTADTLEAALNLPASTAADDPPYIATGDNAAREALDYCLSLSANAHSA